MEVLVVVVAIVAVIGFASRSARSRTMDRSSRRHDAPAPPLPNTSRARTGISHPAPFDDRTAQTVEDRRVLVGAAWVTDGDTITVQKNQIRLFGIDAPELHHPYGQRAKWALHGLCKGETVRAEIICQDDYGRTVARCYLTDGRDLSAEMVRLGLALDWGKFSGGRYRHLETADARRRLFLADARQKGRMHVWEKFDAGNR